MQRVKAMIRANADALWNNASALPPFPKNDRCNSRPAPIVNDGKGESEQAVQPKPQLRRFHWQWDFVFPHGNGSHPIPPPDTSSWFTKQSGVRCINIGDVGMTHSAANCRAKCAADPTCRVYNFADSTKTGYGGDCWLIHNRSAGMCTQDDPNFELGVRRPAADGVCKHVTCGSLAPQPTSDGRGCYCDENCAVHYDCCLDYAEVCAAPQPSCKANCDTIAARAIPGGGYCWCTECEGANDGCCPDYSDECHAVSNPICLDARSHISAMSLFVVDLRLSSSPSTL